MKRCFLFFLVVSSSSSSSSFRRWREGRGFLSLLLTSTLLAAPLFVLFWTAYVLLSVHPPILKHFPFLLLRIYIPHFWPIFPKSSLPNILPYSCMFWTSADGLFSSAL